MNQKLKIGQVNRLEIIKERSVGYFFDGGEAGDILMPKRHQPEHCEVGDELDVFVFHDSEGRLTATVKHPVARVGEVAWLQVVGFHRAGAFLDWGLTKDLLVPPWEQAEPMELDQYYAVRIFLDPYERILGSSRLEGIQESSDGRFKAGQAVDLLIVADTELGFKAIVNHSHWGILYHSEVFQTLQLGQKLKGYIQRIRPDQKIDLSLNPPGYNASQMDQLGQQILTQIEAHGGLLPLTDKSSPEAIREAFGVSKKNFKQAVGKLYKARRILIEPQGLRRAPR